MSDKWFKTAEEVQLEKKQSLIRKLESKRKQQEDQGITHNNIRYSGSPSNRQALNEALQFMEKHELTTFNAWKDSDDQFHLNHPVSEVEEALDLIAANRSRLIEKEAQFRQQILDGELDDVENLDWS